MNWRMGLLAKLTVFDKPEAALEKKLKQNSCYPFERVDDPGPNPVYTYTVRYARFYLALLSSVGSLLFTVVWPAVGGDSQYLACAVPALVLSLYLSLEYHASRTLILDPANAHYSIYRGSVLAGTHHCHNVYVRLVGSRPGTRHPMYRLVLDGFGFDLPIVLTWETANKKKLRHLAHEITSQLNINYFDVHNTSKHQGVFWFAKTSKGAAKSMTSTIYASDIIRHHRPYFTASTEGLIEE